MSLVWALVGLCAIGAPTRPFDLPEAKRDALAELVGARFSAPASTKTSFDGGLAIVAAPRFLYVVDTSLSLPAPPWMTEGAYAEAFDLARQAWRDVEGDQVSGLIVLSTFDERGDSLFYLPLANDVAGLGTGRATRIFDDTPNSPLDGVIWLGPLAALEAAGPDYLHEAFVHEIAHRWSAYVEIVHPELDRAALRGRQDCHWSFLVDSDRSPMEGNAWRTLGDDPARMVTYFEQPLGAPKFSPLNLYLMGVLPPESVPPFMVITAFDKVDPSWLSVQPVTTPAHRMGFPVSLEVMTQASVSIEQVIAGSGERFPRAASEPVIWPVGVVLLSNGLTRADRSTLARLDAHLAELSDLFTAATGGRMRLELGVKNAGLLPLGAPCSSLAACDRTQSEICAAPPTAEPICTRACSSDADCDPSHCCALAAGLCAASCDGTAEPMGPDPSQRPSPDGVPDDGGALETSSASCSCGAHTGPAGTRFGLALLLAGTALLTTTRRARRHVLTGLHPS